MSKEVESYVNKLFLKLGFGELGVNVAEDKYIFEHGGVHFTFEALALAGGGGDFPEFEGLAAIIVSVPVCSYPDLKSIPSQDLMSWLTEPPMFGSLFLQADDEGKPELFLKQETALSGDEDADLMALLFVLDNLHSQFVDRSH